MGPDRHCCVCGPPTPQPDGPRPLVHVSVSPLLDLTVVLATPGGGNATLQPCCEAGGGRRVHGPAPPGSAPSPPDSQHHSVPRADDGLGLERVRSGVFGADRAEQSAEHLLSVSPGISESWPCSVWCVCSVFTVNSRSKARRNRSRMYGHHQVLDTT